MKSLIAASVIAGFFLSTTACNNSTTVREKDAALQAQQHTIDSMNAELAKKKVIDSMNEVAHIQYVIPQQMPAANTAQPVAAAPATSAHHSVRHSHAASSYSSSNNTSVAQAPQAPVYQQAPAAPPQKRGWSAKAKGAAFGAGAGALAGAIINGRNRAAGAVIGGVSGAAVGTGIGAILDKKHGR